MSGKRKGRSTMVINLLNPPKEEVGVIVHSSDPIWICSNIDRVEPSCEEGYTLTSTWPPVRSLMSFPNSSPPLTRGEPGSLLRPIFILMGSAAKTPVTRKRSRTRVQTSDFFMAYLLICVSWWKNAFPTTERTTKAPSSYHG